MNRSFLVALGFAFVLVKAGNDALAADLTRGAKIVEEGTAAGAPACGQCHGNDGAAIDGAGAFPRLSGQFETYIIKQLRDYASGIRENEMMSPVAGALSAEEIEDVAAYYAAKQSPFPIFDPSDPDILERGRQLATVGNAEKSIQACNACHGPQGAGEPPLVPYLAGQYAQSIVSALEAWRSGSRKGSPGAMLHIARLLDDKDIEAISVYYQQVRGSGDNAEAK